jgi:hypothetical protein
LGGTDGKACGGITSFFKMGEGRSMFSTESYHKMFLPSLKAFGIYEHSVNRMLFYR